MTKGEKRKKKVKQVSKKDMVNLWIKSIRVGLTAKEKKTLQQGVLKYAPRSLYRYRSCSEVDISNLEKDIIWMSKPSNFNDPYDCWVKVDVESIMNEIFGGITIPKNVDSEDPNKKMEEIFETIKSHVYVSCFTENYDNLVMWSHYANNHTGFCIEYDAIELSDITEKADRIEGQQAHLSPVQYSDKIYTSKDVDSTFNSKLVFTLNKSSDWSYEDEWRVVHITIPRTIESVYDIEYSERIGKKDYLKAKAIYLGNRIKKDDEEKIIRICKSKGIPVYKMELETDFYGLKPIVKT